MTDITTWYLESLSATDLIPARPAAAAQIVEAEVKQYEFNRFLYQLVGKSWQWHDKLIWSDEAWRDYAEADNLRTWVAWLEGSPAGYFELQMQEYHAVEICYFGLAEKFIGRGLGGALLAESIRQAWEWGASRVWVHTCSLDHPAALANYQARGMVIYKTEAGLAQPGLAQPGLAQPGLAQPGPAGQGPAEQAPPQQPRIIT